MNFNEKPPEINNTNETEKNPSFNDVKPVNDLDAVKDQFNISEVDQLKPVPDETKNLELIRINKLRGTSWVQNYLNELGYESVAANYVIGLAVDKRDELDKLKNVHQLVSLDHNTMVDKHSGLEKGFICVALYGGDTKDEIRVATQAGNWEDNWDFVVTKKEEGK